PGPPTGRACRLAGAPSDRRAAAAGDPGGLRLALERTEGDAAEHVHRLRSHDAPGDAADRPPLAGRAPCPSTDRPVSVMHPTTWWTRLDDGRIRCDVCPRACALHEGQTGLCFVRMRDGDQIALTTSRASRR